MYIDCIDYIHEAIVRRSSPEEALKISISIIAGPLVYPLTNLSIILSTFVRLSTYPFCRRADPVVHHQKVNAK